MRQLSFNMHRYILGLVLVFSACVTTFPIAMMRVSQTEKFSGQPLKSLACNGKPATSEQQIITQLPTCPSN